MKKAFVLMITFFMVFSINGFSMDKNHKTAQTAKTAQHSRGSAKTGRKPPKPKARKKIHKSKSKRHMPKKTGHAIRL
ncbi:MAG: hypothetical protein ABSA76_11045 [Bacteroidales bacterium]